MFSRMERPGKDHQVFKVFKTLRVQGYIDRDCEPEMGACFSRILSVAGILAPPALFSCRLQLAGQ